MTTPTATEPVEPLTLAVWQCTPLPLDKAGNLARLAATARAAAAQGADALVVPEMFSTGYAIGAEAVRGLAEPFDGPLAAAVGHIAHANRIAIAYGYPELGMDGAVYNAAQWISATGQHSLNHRKAHLFGDLDRSQFAAAPVVQPAPLVTLKGWSIGMLICYEVEFPENTRRLALAGADLIVVPTANMRGFDFVATHMVPVRAYENQLAVAYANYVGAEAIPGKPALTYGGLSSVVGFDGLAIASAAGDASLLVARLLPEALKAAREACTHVRDVRALFAG